MATINNILALDIGDVRIGVAVANPIARLPRPLTTLVNDDQVWQQLKKLVDNESVGLIVVGLPRNLQGNDTEQTQKTRQFAAELKQQLKLPIYWQDEALTSKSAEARLKASKKPYTRPEVDSMAAAIILDDFLARHNQEHM